MPIGNRQFIQPMGRRFALPMATIGHWTNGTMDHEWLFWDSGEFTKQLGLAKQGTTEPADVARWPRRHAQSTKQPHPRR